MDDGLWSAVERAARGGEAEGLVALLADVHPRRLHDAFALSAEVADRNVALALVEWIIALEEPGLDTPRHQSWLSAHNNACFYAVSLDALDPDRAAAIARKALAVAEANPPIYHNAAAVFCRLGRRDEAMDVVRSGIATGWDRIDAMMEDEDLLPLRDDPEFQRLMAPFVQAAEDAIEEKLAPWRAKFAPEDPPTEFIKIIREQHRGLDLPPGIIALRPDDDVPSAATPAVAEGVVWVCRVHGATYRTPWSVGYGRTESGLSGVISVNEVTGVTLAAACLWDVLVLQGTHGGARGRARVELSATNHGVTLNDVESARAQREEADERLARWRLEHEEPIASERWAKVQELAANPGDHTETIWVLQPSTTPWHGSVARIGGPAVGVSADQWPRDEDGLPLSHLLTVDLDALPAARELDEAFGEARAFAIFAKEPRALSIDETRCIVIPREAALEDHLEGVAWPRRTFRWKPLAVDAAALEAPTSTWTLAQASLAEALHGCTWLRRGDGAKLQLAPEDIDFSATHYRSVYHIGSAGLSRSQTTTRASELVKICGAPVSARSRLWSDFASGPRSVLEQLLVRLCVLAAPHFSLSFALRIDGIEWNVDGRTRTVTIDESSVREGLLSIFDGLGEWLGECGVPWRFVQASRRVLLLNAAWGHFFLDHEALEKDEPIPSKGEDDYVGPLPTVPPLGELVDDKYIYAQDASYASLLAAHIGHAAKYFGAKEFSIEPRFVQPSEGDEVHLSAKSGHVSWSPRLVGASDTWLRPMIRDLNNYVFDEAERCVYEYRAEMFDVGLVFASEGEAEALREFAYLAEDWRADWARTTLDGQGIKISNYTHTMSALRLVRQMNALGEGDPELKLVPEDGAYLLHVGEVRLPIDLSDRHSRLASVLHVLTEAINGALKRGGHDHRWVVHHGEYSPRLLRLDVEWAGTLSEFLPTVSRSLETDFEWSRKSLLPIAYPRPSPAFVTKSVPKISSVVPEARILHTDFKCSARGSDYPDLFLEIAELAGVDVIAEPYAPPVPGTDYHALDVSFGGEHVTLQIENRKYADASPMLDYLNSILAAEESAYRLSTFYTADSGGVVFIDAEEGACLAEFELARWPDDD